MRVVITEVKRGCKISRRFSFDLDGGKYPMCYRSRTSSNAFFHSLKHYNWRGGKQLNNFDTLYHFQFEDEFQQNTKIFEDALKLVGAKLPEDYNILIELPNLWEFYKAIGWDYKTKKWIK